ncbi:MAG: glutamate racemase [Clostridia bacterium]|nr:glutamate racemase [Clostridia bacterium]
MADERAIGIFDSGLGGLTVAREIMKKLPKENIVYFGDTGRVPYGTRSTETIIKYTRQDERFLLSQDVKLIVAACGTVSSVAADTAKELPVPFIEVVSHSVNAALKATKNKKIGILATAATINSGSHKKRILEKMPDALVVENSGTLLVPLVEEGWYSEDDPVVRETVRRYVEPMMEAGVDTLILGCTHFPVLSRTVSAVMGDAVTLINMGTAAAEAVVSCLEKSGGFAERECILVKRKRFLVLCKLHKGGGEIVFEGGDASVVGGERLGVDRHRTAVACHGVLRRTEGGAHGRGIEQYRGGGNGVRKPRP